jgi:hypothetical protein
MKHTKIFEEFINEARFNSKDFTFTITHFTDKNGLSIQFIPDSKTLDSHSKNEMVDFIMSKLEKIKVFNGCFTFRSGSGSAGMVFNIDGYCLVDNILKEIK